MSDLIFARIGRDRTPAERTLANTREHPELAEHCARNLFHTVATGGSWRQTIENERDWLDLSDNERAEWIAAAISMIEEDTTARDRPDPPDPPGGLPLEAVA